MATEKTKLGGSHQPVNILLVDDQPGKLLTYEAMLGDLGENLIRATSGNEALEQLLKQDVAVILIDVCMPGLDGFELAAMIRRHPRFQKTAIIHVSAVNLTELDRIKGYESGAVDYVAVPIVPEILRAKVKVFADLYRKTQELERLNRELEHRVSKRTEQLEVSTARLTQSEARFRFLADTIPSFVWTAAPDGAITYANQYWRQYCGLDAEQHARDWQELVLHPDDRERCRAQWAEALREAKEYSVDARYRRHDDVYRWFLNRAVPQKAGHEVVGWFGVAMDIDEQKVLAERLQESDRRKDQFLAMLAHELRNPVAAINNALGLVRHAGRTESQASYGHDVIDRQTKHLSRLIDDLLEVNRIAHDKLDLRQEPVELAEVVEAALESCRPAIEQNGRKLNVSLPLEPVRIHADRVRLAQVFLNLLDNAAKYTRHGGRIGVVAEREEDGVVVRVKDNGVGMSQETLSRIFEMFYQADQSLERQQGGLGLGLNLARRLVELHGGTLEARSAGVGQGSEFVVRLPVLADAAATPGSAAGGEPASVTEAKRKKTAAVRRVLVADDNEDGAESLALFLRLAGHEVATARDGEEALEVAHRFKPDVALLDIGMPRLNGCDAARRIREQPWGKDILLIAATGWAQAEDRRRTKDAGFDHHLVKPVEPAALLELIATGAPRKG